MVAAVVSGSNAENISIDFQRAVAAYLPLTINNWRLDESTYVGPNNLLLPMFSVVDVDRGCPHVWAKSIFVEQDSAASIVGDVETVCEAFVLQILYSFL